VGTSPRSEGEVGQLFGERERVERRPYLDVVVEVDHDVVPGSVPAPHLGGPPAQRGGVVAADVELGRAV